MSSKKEIFDALTCDSSGDGCDPDWRNKVLENADPDDRAFVEDQLGENSETENETWTRLRRGDYL